MKIGLLSDTHKKEGRSQKVIDHLKRQGADFLIHAGDIVKPEILEQLKNSGLRYVAVYGNNDAQLVQYHSRYNLVQEPHYFKLGGINFKLMHLPFYMNSDAEVVIFGHTHIFECDFKNHTLFLNPGETCARNEPFSSCAMLEITDTSLIVTHYSRAIGSNSFDERHYTFERS
ncbi:YfcE family phosphodiesterase [Sulfuricurvum sp.]|uniref:metallophosphoesterase family protein n=1 Tax=Sulfuricurvum sp. TaxID=2025608 RepID=UPI0019B34DCF|nr:YfcE family phosphodiesterase [Sulfuricurvum sp.]MBD3799655.1 YfcE family phosphodiesterase [Campylobacterota bacterium]MBD3806952.1 YfcE family phosphodiesterase [Sulfuricurvum sp.]